MTYTLETIGGGQMLWTLFNAIASLLRPGGGSLMQAFVVLGTAIGAVAALGYTVFRNDLKPFLSWFVSSQILILGLLLPVSTVVIKDVLTGHVQRVANVPFALAFTASTLSSIGTGITQAIEVAFQAAPNFVGGRGFQNQGFEQMAYSKTGFMFASHVMVQMKGVQLANDDLAENLKEFVNQCVVYDALIGTNYTMHDLKRSDDIWGLVSRTATQLRGFSWRDVNRAADGSFLNSNGTSIITCKVGVQRFNEMWQAANESLLTRFQGKLCEQFGLSQNIRTHPLSNAIATTLPGALNKLTHSAKQASRHLQQQIMISSLLISNERKSIELGGSANFDVRRAYLQQRDTYQTIGQNIAQTLPSLKNVLEALVYALFIFIVMLAMLPGGWKILTFYTKIMLWLHLWPPLFSILNFIMTESLSSATAGAIGTAQGITIANMVGLSNIASDMAATAGYLSSMIPILSWALIERGGYAFVSMASGILGVTQQAATSAAIEKSTGNYSFGNVNLEGMQAYNSNMLKHDTSASYTGGHFATNEGTMARNFTAGGETILNHAESHLPVTISAQSSREEVLQEALTKADSLQHSYGEAASNSSRSAAIDYIEFGKHLSSMRASDVKFDNTETGAVMKEAATNYEKLQQFAQKYGMTQDIVNQHAASIQGGFGINFGVASLGGSYENTETAVATAQMATEELNQLVKSDSFRESMSHMHQASVNKSFNTNNQKLNDLVENVSGSYEKSIGYEHQSNKAREVSNSLRSEQLQNRTQGMRVDANLTQDFVNHMGADNIATMSTQGMQRAASLFSESKMADYRQYVFQKLDTIEIKKGFDTHYKDQPLRHSEQDVSNAFEARQGKIRQDAYRDKAIVEVDDTVKDSTEHMIALNSAKIVQRGKGQQSKVEEGEARIVNEIKEKATKNLSNLQSVAAINSYEKLRKKNEES